VKRQDSTPSRETIPPATAAEARDVQCPTFLVTEDEDPIGPPTTVRVIGDRMSDARTLVLSRCGHWPTLERPQDVNAALRDFYFGRSMAVGTQRARPRYDESWLTAGPAAPWPPPRPGRVRSRTSLEVPLGGRRLRTFSCR
jgi:hypothetical protein